MTEDFSKPRRQSPVGVIVMFFDTIRQFVRALLPVLLIWIFKIDSTNKIFLALGIGVFFLAISVIAYLRYRNFTFWLDEDADEFVVSEGVFNKTRTAIRLGKIQQVNINQSLIQRIVGVYAVEVDSAGSSKNEGSIKAVSHPLAIALKTRLMDNRKASGPENRPAAEASVVEAPLIKIGLPSLLKVGFTSNYVRTIGLMLAFFVTMYDNFRQIGESAVDEETIGSVKNLVVQSAAIIIGVLFLSVIVINVVRILVQFFNFTIARQQGSLLLSFGLVSTRSTILKPEKVQITAVTQNYFQKKLDVTEIRIRQASQGQQEHGKKRQIVEIPGCDSNEKDKILALLYGAVPESGLALRPNFRKLVFAIFLWILLPVLAFWIMAERIPELRDFALAVPVYAAFMGLIAYFSFRNYRLFISDGHIVKQSGAWDVTREIIQPAKIQSISVSQLFWHRGIGVASLTLRTAGGDLSFSLGRETDIRAHVNRWLFEIEGGNRDWG